MSESNDLELSCIECGGTVYVGNSSYEESSVVWKWVSFESRMKIVAAVCEECQPDIIVKHVCEQIDKEVANAAKKKSD